MNSLLRNVEKSHGSRELRCEPGEVPTVMPSEFLSPVVRHSKSYLLEDTTEVDRYILTRAEFADPSLSEKPVVVLTGAWPHGPSKLVVELDTTIDRRFAWVDREAERLAELAGGEVPDRRAALPVPWVNVLGLRYYLLKLLRVIEYFSSVQPPSEGERIGVIADQADGDDVAILAALCRRAGAECRLRWHGNHRDEEDSVSQPEEWWRRAMRCLADRLRLTGNNRNGGHRVVLCGSPRFLDPVCQVLYERKCRVWWLYDRFAVKPFCRWHIKGITQLTCQDSPCREDTSEADPIDLPPLEYRGVDLRGLVSEWLAHRLVGRRHDQRRWFDQIHRHFQQIRPDLLVMDEDATPMKRIALAIARRYGGKTFVVQHGAPVARFGFAPLAADGFFAWGLSTREQLERWGIAGERVFMTGSPSHDALFETLHKAPKNIRPGSSSRILLLATVPPRDRRPDLIELNLNSRSYHEMIEAAFAAAEAIPGATLVVKPHPRTKTDPVIQAAVSRHPNLQVELIQSGSLAESLRGIDCVLSCLSSAGIEATLADTPVIQLIPRGAGHVLPADRWGLFGSASNEAELLPLIRHALHHQGPRTSAALDAVFANTSFWGRQSNSVPDSATRIVAILLEQVNQSISILRNDVEQGCSKAAANR